MSRHQVQGSRRAGDVAQTRPHQVAGNQAQGTVPVQDEQIKEIEDRVEQELDEAWAFAEVAPILCLSGNGSHICGLLKTESPAVICQDKNNIERYTFSYVSKRQKHPPKPCKSYF